MPVIEEHQSKKTYECRETINGMRTVRVWALTMVDGESTGDTLPIVREVYGMYAYRYEVGHVLTITTHITIRLPEVPIEQ